ncbi:hypothetical protein [Bacillus cereus]|uniref:hypothetical protein n=1 Tax=Bacillus cereus TaxID=1396 RepID=UPI000BFE4B5E|nr:hypothetical protein [Bacillus cereus]PGR83471.1 hypothetical protein COC63_05665 [Bacillus cereus]
MGKEKVFRILSVLCIVSCLTACSSTKIEQKKKDVQKAQESPKREKEEAEREKQAQTEEAITEWRYRTVSLLRELEEDIANWKQTNHQELAKADKEMLVIRLQEIYEDTRSLNNKVKGSVENKEVEGCMQRLVVTISQAKKGHVVSVYDLIREVENRGKSREE